MAKVFNAKQEQLLTALLPGLQSGKIGCNWHVMFSSEGATIFEDVHTENFHTLGWNKATQADFHKFVKYGLFTSTGQNGNTLHYVLDDVAIIEVHKRGFDMPETSAPGQSVYNFQGNTFSGITNINSILEHSTQSIQNSTSLAPNFKETFSNLLSQLQEALGQIPPEYESKAQTVAKQADRLAEDVATSQPDREGVQITADGLKKAAENLATVAPMVLTIAMEIVRHVATH